MIIKFNERIMSDEEKLQKALEDYNDLLRQKVERMKEISVGLKSSNKEMEEFYGSQQAFYEKHQVEHSRLKAESQKATDALIDLLGKI